MTLTPAKCLYVNGFQPVSEFVVKAKENIKKEDQAIDQIAVGLVSVMYKSDEGDGAGSVYCPRVRVFPLSFRSTQSWIIACQQQNNLEEMSKAMGLELERQSGQIESLDGRVCLQYSLTHISYGLEIET